MRKIQRLLLLGQWARESKKISFQDMCEKLEASPATVKRDIRYLREDLNITLIYDTYERCYRFHSSVPRSSFEVQGLWVHDDDLFALWLAQQLIEDTGYYCELTHRLGRLLYRLQGCKPDAGALATSNSTPTSDQGLTP
jgi:predicted DNA-binding transcriptional regulator YafY